MSMNVNTTNANGTEEKRNATGYNEFIIGIMAMVAGTPVVNEETLFRTHLAEAANGPMLHFPGYHQYASAVNLAPWFGTQVNCEEETRLAWLKRTFAKKPNGTERELYGETLASQLEALRAQS